jgi:predicted acylesterase/phospholipase RssA
MRNLPPRRLVFSGGGIRVISYIGALQVFHEHNLLKHVKEFCGVSAGGLTALMLALGYSLPTLERFTFHFDFSNIRSIDPETIFTVTDTFGIDDGAELDKLLCKILFHKGFGPTTTFGDLAASGKCAGLRVWAADIQYMNLLEFSARTTPNIEVRFALRASMAIPFYFIPLRHPETGTLLVDGGVLDNYPISVLTEEESEESIGLTFDFSEKPMTITNVGDFLSRICSGYYMPSYQRLLERHRARTIVVPIGEFPSLHFEATAEDKQLLVRKGREATEAFLRVSGGEPPPIRRHSVA